MRTTVVIQDTKHASLKRLAHERGISLGQLIKKAVDQTYFSGLSLKALKGSCRGANLSKQEIDAVKIKAPKAL